jgi:hypothetical protein
MKLPCRRTVGQGSASAVRSRLRIYIGVQSSCHTAVSSRLCTCMLHMRRLRARLCVRLRVRLRVKLRICVCREDLSG